MMPLWLAGAAAVAIAVLAIVALSRGQFGLGLLIVALTVLVGAGGAMLFARSLASQAVAERLALAQRQDALTGQMLAPGSPLACLGGAAGEAVEAACEKLIFGRPDSVAAAVAVMAARLSLLSDALTFSRQTDPDTAQQVGASFAGLRRAVELDRYGIAAHVLADRDGCTADKCPIFELLTDATVLKANLKARAFATYVARYAPQWIAEPAGPPVAEAVPPGGAGAQASLPAASGPDPHKPVDEKYDFPSAASIPPVSIMNAEPPRTDTGAAAAGAAGGKAGSSAASSTSPPPVPPHRPQNRIAAPD